MFDLFKTPLPVTTGQVNRNRPLELFRQPLPVFFPDDDQPGLDSAVAALINKSTTQTRASLDSRYATEAEDSAHTIQEDPNDPGTFVSRSV